MDGHGQYSVDGVLESNSAVNEHAKASKRSMHGGIFFLKKIQSCCWPLKKIYHQFDTFHDAGPVLVLVLVLGVSIIIVRIAVAKVLSFLLIILK